MYDFEKVKTILEKLENETYDSTGIRRISGGFAEADVFDFDDNYVDVKLEWGIQSDCENVVHTEYYKIDLKTYELEEV